MGQHLVLISSTSRFRSEITRERSLLRRGTAPPVQQRMWLVARLSSFLPQRHRQTSQGMQRRGFVWRAAGAAPSPRRRSRHHHQLVAGLEASRQGRRTRASRLDSSSTQPCLYRRPSRSTHRQTRGMGFATNAEFQTHGRRRCCARSRSGRSSIDESLRSSQGVAPPGHRAQIPEDRHAPPFGP